MRAIDRGESGTAAWSRHQAQLLLQLADQMRSDAPPSATTALATEALRQAETADRLANSLSAQVSAKALAGQIYERYLNDPANALRSYEAAAALAPTRHYLKDAVFRLQRAAAYSNNRSR